MSFGKDGEEFMAVLDLLNRSRLKAMITDIARDVVADKASPWHHRIAAESLCSVIDFPRQIRQDWIGIRRLRKALIITSRQGGSPVLFLIKRAMGIPMFFISEPYTEKEAKRLDGSRLRVKRLINFVTNISAIEVGDE